uniref:Uncharacterized protein n=1 Tax=Thermosporothrix sp. COM3 TaxID=2490863 RepID=A0A455SUC0_9CHLR|nr:hypothetical protein KTC_34950 [Thermosporothrix sp. COM3]
MYCHSEQYLKVMTNGSIGHPFARSSRAGQIAVPTTLRRTCKRSELHDASFTSLKGFTSKEVACEKV